MRPGHLLSIALASTTISAWSLDSLVDTQAVQRFEGLFRRQDSSSSNTDNASSTTSQAASTAKSSQTSDQSTAKSSTDTSKQTSTDSSDDSKTTDASSASSGKTSSGGSTAKTTGSSGTTAQSSGKATVTQNTQSYNASVGFGGLTMLTPNPQSSSSYYKVGNFLTFAWNFTSLSVTPTAVDIIATCTANQATYTLAMNQTVHGSTGAITWDTGEYQATATVPLLTETYTLIIHDAALDASATADYGHLAAYSAFKFAMYTKQAYTGLGEGWKCVTCSGAMSMAEKQTMGFLFAMAGVTVVTFTWFAGSFGVF